MRWSIGIAVLGLATVGLVASASAQDTLVWSPIDCAQSKIIGPTKLKCESTQEYHGGNALNAHAGPEGSFQHWRMYGTIDKVWFCYFLKEATATGSSILPVTLDKAVRDNCPQGRHATKYSEVAAIGGGDYARFTNTDGYACIVTRKVGAATKLGNKWYLLALKCVRNSPPLPDSDAAALLAAANAPNAGF
jgi:hypothetical protein